MPRFLTLCAAVALAGASPLALAVSPQYADAVVSFSQGAGTTHPNFLDPQRALGAPDYADPADTGFGVGAVALGRVGTIVVRMGAGFTVGGSPAADLFVYEIGPSQGGTAERTTVSISRNGSDWFTVGVAPGGTSGLDIDGFGFAPTDVFRYVRLVDLTANGGRPAGADIDAIAAVSAVPEPSATLLAALGLVALRCVRRRPKLS